MDSTTTITVTDLSEEQQHELIHQAICAIAARCDGAVQQDGVGFNGQDTKFGRRVAAIPFEQWTDDIKAECARIVLTYNQQALAYTGVDFSKLPVVRSAQQWGSNPNARIQAREAARRSERMVEVTQRTATLEGGDLVRIHWARKDPDFNALLEAVRACPGRSWDGSAWTVPLGRDVAEFLKTFEYRVSRPLADAVRNLLSAPPAVVYNVLLADQPGRAIVRAPYDAARVADSRALPGRRWDGARKVDEVDLCPALLDYARRWGLAIDPAVETAIAKGPTVEEDPLPALLLTASSAARPEDLPAAFLALLA